MKYVLNKQKGSTVNHPVVGKIEGLVAYEIEDELAEQLKHIINLVVFDKVVYKDKPKKKDGSNTSSNIS